MSKSDGVHDILGDIARGNLESLEALLEKAELKEKEAMGKVLRRERSAHATEISASNVRLFFLLNFTLTSLQYIRNA